MARLRCTCGMVVSVQPGVPTARCPNCYATIFCPNSNGYTVPTANQYNGYAYSYSNHYPTTYNSYSYYSPPPRPSPQLSTLSVYGRKRALLIGISYYGQEKSIKGSVNDVRLMTNFLLSRLGFPKESVFVLTEEETNPCLIPTKQNIRTALRWLIQGCQSGDSLVFFYSGHGSQVLDWDGDELDGYDESLCPLDYQTHGKILDDEINATIIRPLPHGVKLHAIIDTCSSGTFLDLPFICRMNRLGYYAWQDQRNTAAYKGTNGGTAICISACDDHETSLDTTAFAPNIVTGALTYSFIQIVGNETGLTYGRLLHSLRSKICEVQKRIQGPNQPTSQVPQLSCTEMFDVHSKPFMF
ncbi:metacaspase-3-like [Actinidia eriantha]|uniref:metacaspase-3-like n=1 Tax=Actinidia eriantha TaxID=165200 RepID=UPI00258EE834|nr:metacaspase-3-like [Actinidia eriantha]